MPPAPSALLFDLDGTLYVGSEPVAGAAAALERLRRRGVPFRFVSNTTSRPRAALAERLRGFGIAATADQIRTPMVAAGAVLAERGIRVVAPFTPEAGLVDLEGVALAGGVSRRAAGSRPDAVLIGDLGELWTYRLLQEAFDHVLAGAELIALSRDRYFRRDGSLALDAGPFVAAIEYAASRDALLVGKPSPVFFKAAAAGLPGEEDQAVAMVGDDLWSDVAGAQKSGYAGWLVRTGKFDPDALAASGIAPDRILDSVAQVDAGIEAGA
jgi:HAD superfamily hydrolase (TIGR01458 family)